jgi:hypothetical protein
MTTKQRYNEKGAAHLVALAVIVLIAVVGFAGWRVLSAQKDTSDQTSTQSTSQSNNQNNTNTNTKSNKITWTFENDAWKANKTPPKCPSPLLTISPVDINKATSILYPGQTRGIYKAHGGFRLDAVTDNNVTTKLAMDGRLVRAARYVQADQVQYLLDFENECGVALRYDHLLTLSNTFKDIVSKLPEPKVNDSTTTDIHDNTLYKSGEVLATQVGFLAPAQNTAVDFGVYDYRQPNNASKDPAYASAHKSSNATDFYAICWLNELPAADAAIAKSLPGGDGKAGKTSDYCQK